MKSALAPRYASLSSGYHAQVTPDPLPGTSLIHFNSSLAQELGVNEQGDPLLEVLAGNAPWPGYAPISSIYAGHQFGSWVSQLGDGRAHMIAEIAKPDGSRAELQLKGSGKTPFSRGSDGRAVLRSSIREYLCSEAMHALGIPTTRCLSLVASPHPVQREEVETAAVVCRVSPSFVRFGHFEYFYHKGEHDMLAPLADHVIAENFPHLAGQAGRYAAWLKEVIERTARLMAQWQGVGFCHGVMNTDNFSILGLTLDYGPYGFMDTFRQNHVCNHSDYEGRYAYGAQPEIGQWNCSCLLQAALPLLSSREEEAAEIASELYKAYAPAFSVAAIDNWTAKLGLLESRENDPRLIVRFLEILQKDRRDFTQSFRSLASVRAEESSAVDTEYDAWLGDYRARLRSEGSDDEARAARMNRVNPKYVLRNHLAQEAIEKAGKGDYSGVDDLMRVLAAPYEEQPDRERYAEAPLRGAPQIEVSCSS